MRVKSESEVAQLCLTLCNPMDCSLPGSSVRGIFQARVLEWGAIAFSATVSQSLLKFMPIELVMLSMHLILCCPLRLLPLIFPSIRVFSKQSVLCIRWPKCWNFSISPFSDYSRLISFRMAWLDLLAVQGTVKSLLQQSQSISSSVLSLLYGPALTSVHDRWDNHSFNW